MLTASMRRLTAARALRLPLSPCSCSALPLTRHFAASSSAPKAWKVDNPYTGKIHCEVPLHSDADVAAIVAAASKAQRSHYAASSSGLRDRQLLCGRFCDLLQQQRQSVAADITGMMGKPITQALGEVDTCISRARSLIAQSASALAAVPASAAFPSSSLSLRIEKEPIGVVLSLCPWNYPLLCAVNSVIPAVLAGNAVLLKHSDRTPLVASVFSSLFATAGAPAHLVSDLQITHEQVATLTQHPSIGYIQFTGSVEGGRAVYRRVGESRFIDVGLELGGKDAAYVAADADMDTAVAGVVEGALYNAGQSCCAVERVILHSSIAQQFIARAKEIIAEQWRAGDPSLAETALGPLAQPAAPARIASMVAAAVSDGAKLVTGGKAMQHEGRGRFLSPALVVGCSRDSVLMREETFGPVVACAEVSSDEEAVELINHSRYGLTASVWSRSTERIERVAAQLDVGTVYGNRCDVLEPELVWSGRKDSGKGFGLSPLGFLPFIRTKSYNIRSVQSKSK